MNKYSYKNLTPFKWFVLENFPFIEADFDALTEWQLFCKLGKEINKIIDSQNIVGEQAENLTNAFNNLKNYVDNYFNNLDVQDEINNKLNEMAEDGTLQEIIGEYLSIKSLLSFDNVSDMIKSENLIEGSYAQTFGFHNINDGGSKKYKIIKEENAQNVNGRTKINLLHDDLYAISLNDTINVREYGAKGDGITDDTETIQFCIDNFPHRNIYIPNGEYLISSPLKVKTGNEYQVNLILEDNAIIKTNTKIDSLLEIAKDIQGTYNRYSPYGKMLVQGGVWDATNTTYGIYTTSNRKFTIFKDLYIINVAKYGIYLDRGTIDSMSTDARLFNISISGNGADINPDAVGLYIYGSDNEIDELRIQNIKKGIYCNAGGDFLDNVHITGCYSKNDITPEEYNDTIGIELYSTIFCNNIYVDTMAQAVVLRGGAFNCNNFFTFYWKTNENFNNTILKYYTTVTTAINNMNIALPSVGKNVGIDITNIPYDRERNSFTYRNQVYIQNNLFILNRETLNQYDLLLCLQLRHKYNYTEPVYPHTWNLPMAQNAYYKILGLKEGLYRLKIFNNDDQIIEATVNANDSGSITVQNLANMSHTNEYTLHLIKSEEINGLKYYMLAFSSSSSNTFYGISVEIENHFDNQCYEVYEIHKTIENPNIIASANFNP